MRPSRFLAAAAIAVAVPLFASIDLPRDSERWTKIELDDYVIYSAARDSATRDAAQRLQLMRDGLAMITPFRDAGMGKKMTQVSALFGGSPDAELTQCFTRN